ncbi:vesicle-associated membrane protein 5 [Xenopus laevis]|uniref:Vesicle-associated membrane protein 5 n=2 Tax=Xenopus laevis TaxID=8355 RepID=A0A1L8GRY9_XENLA|nr:vesicle-associated membrane protein 5 [Xenopus laevis]OCT86612.1 hypothetical protein XELAEV_18020294mg [Xenopus laevis]
MANNNLELCQSNAEEVKVLMKNNVDKVIEREGKISDLEDRSNDLLSMASTFQRTAQKVERHTRWQKWRWYIIAGGIVAVIVVIIIIIIVLYTVPGQSDP